MIDAKKVRSECVEATETTPDRRLFTDIVTSNSIFFCAASLHHPDNGSTMVSVGSSGYYWSASPSSSSGYKTMMRINESDVQVLNNSLASYGFTVRYVKVTE